MPLFLNIDDVNAMDLSGLDANLEDRVRAKGHDMKRVHGTEAAFAVSLRKSGYHSSPHIHDFEQLNYIQEGEMWFFIHDETYHVKKGDFLRIPRNAIHWSWVKTKEPSLVDGNLEAHYVVLAGTHQGELMGVAPTGRAVEFSGVEIVRVDGGKVVEYWGAMDTMTLMQQIGALPE